MPVLSVRPNPHLGDAIGGKPRGLSASP
jgi:hypothetical protein